MVLETAQILRCRGVGRAADERRERADGRRPFSVCTNSCDGPASETLHLSRHSGKTENRPDRLASRHFYRTSAPAEAPFLPVDSMSTRGAPGLMRERHWRMMGALMA